MKFKSLHPVIWTESFEETIGFYAHILKFSLVTANNKLQWAFLEKDEV